MTTNNFCFYLQNRLIQTSQTGGQWYSDTSPFSIPCYRTKIVTLPAMVWPDWLIFIDNLDIFVHSNVFKFVTFSYLENDHKIIAKEYVNNPCMFCQHANVMSGTVAYFSYYSFRHYIAI